VNPDRARLSGRAALFVRKRGVDLLFADASFGHPLPSVPCQRWSWHGRVSSWCLESQSPPYRHRAGTRGRFARGPSTAGVDTLSRYVTPRCDGAHRRGNHGPRGRRHAPYQPFSAPPCWGQNIATSLVERFSWLPTTVTGGAGTTWNSTPGGPEDLRTLGPEQVLRIRTECGMDADSGFQPSVPAFPWFRSVTAEGVRLGS
jgi:hypothetical protein